MEVGDTNAGVGYAGFFTVCVCVREVLRKLTGSNSHKDFFQVPQC